MSPPSFAPRLLLSLIAAAGMVLAGGCLVGGAEQEYIDCVNEGRCVLDDGLEDDAGTSPSDAGTTHDSGINDPNGMDGGTDAGFDAGAHDGGEQDGGVEEDAGSQTDAGDQDAGSESDAGEEDAGTESDAGEEDAGSTDAGSTDAGGQDAGPQDAGGSTDAGGPPPSLHLSSGALAAAGQCSDPVTVSLLDSSGFPYYPPVDVDVTVGSPQPNVAPAFFLDPDCLQPVPSSGVTIPAFTDATTFHFIENAPGSLTLLASASGFITTSGTQQVEPNLALIGPVGPVGVSTCETFTVYLTDGDGGFWNPGPNSYQVFLSTFSSFGSATLWEVNGTSLPCSTPTSSVLIGPSGPTGSFGFSDSMPGTVTVNAMRGPADASVTFSVQGGSTSPDGGPLTPDGGGTTAGDDGGI